MKTYESKKHPGVFIQTDCAVDEKYKTVLITFSDGKTQTISIATLKRWWTLVDTPELSEPVQVESTKVDEETTPIVSKAIIKKEPEQKLVNATTFDTALSDILALNKCELKRWDSKPKMLGIRYNGKSIMDLYLGKKTFKARVRHEILDDTEKYELHNYMFDATIDLSYDTLGYTGLNSLVSRSLIYNPVRKHRKDKKEEN